MTRTVYLHVGCPKSGTTYLQRILDASRDQLAAAGVLVVGERHVDRVQAALQVRQDPRWRKLPRARQDMWGALVAEIRAWTGPSAVLSYELFSAATAQQAARALADLAAYDVHVVVTGRDLSRSVPSAWQERLKFGARIPLEEWEPSKGGREWGWRTTDPASVARRWGADLPADHVHVVTVPRGAEDPSLLWRRFAEACGLTGIDVTFPGEAVNESLGAVEAELLRRVNAHLRSPLDGSRERALWLRNVLAHQVLAPLGEEPLGLTDAQFAEAQERAKAAIRKIAKRGYAVHGDLDDLKAVRKTGRMTGDVATDEVLDVASRAIVELLVRLREASTARPGSATADEPAGLGARLAAPYRARKDDRLRARIAELEAQVAQGRQLHQRVAALHDVVTELLLPAHLRDGKVTARAIRDYRKGSM